MATYVLIHGIFAGGWQWQEVAGMLRKSGQQVYTPTLTGLGERVHLVNPDIDLSTHIQDVFNVLVYEDLGDVILVGYSAGGLVASGVAELAADRIAHLVFLDALVPQDGQSAATMGGPDIMGFFVEAANAHGDGWRIPSDPSNDPRHTAQPLKPLQQPVSITKPEAAKIPRTFILCKRGMEDIGPLHLSAARTAEMVKNDDSWRYRELDSGHMPMWTHPQELTELLLEVS